MRILAFLCGAIIGPWMIVLGIAAFIVSGYLPLVVLGVLLTGASWTWLSERDR
jgi:hypothetical protein